MPIRNDPNMVRLFNNMRQQRGAITPSLTGQSSAADELFQGATPEEIRMRKKKLMAAGNADPMSQYGNAAYSLFGRNPT